MPYSVQDVMDYIEQEDVKFIRLAFSDVFGHQKNISIMPSELPRAFEYGVSFDASAIDGFGEEEKSDLFLFPEPDTLEILPWRPSHGRVVRLYCSVKYPDGTPFEMDGRYILRRAVKEAMDMGVDLCMGAEYDFYLFNSDEEGNSTYIPHDKAGYMDIAPDDKGEDVRREICLTLEEMGITPMCSHHQYGPGQHEIDFRPAAPLKCADNAMTFMTVVRTMAHRNGLTASFEPKPLTRYPGNGFHINVSLRNAGDCDKKKSELGAFLAGVLEHICEITAFLNPMRQSYERLGSSKAPKFITWSRENRSQLVRVPTVNGDSPRLELRSPDPASNPYIAFALVIYAGLDGIRRSLTPPEAADINPYLTDPKTSGFKSLPSTPEEAFRLAQISPFVDKVLPRRVIDVYMSTLF